MVTLPHGSWPTPITSELVVRSARLPNGVRVDGDDVWWSEGRPEEAGRIAVLRRRADGSVDDVLPVEHSARARRCTSTAAEPGGCAEACCGSRTGRRSACIGSRSAALRSRSHRSPRCPGVSGTPTVTCIPTAPRSSASKRSTTPTEREATNTIVRLRAHEPSTPEVVVAGPDFVSDPRWRPDGGAFCWLEWDHPDMPWDATRLVVDDHGARTRGGRGRRAGVDRPARVDARWLALVLR